MKKAIAKGLLSVALLAALGGEARAQSAGSIAGSVRDSSGGALPGASVTITDPAQARR
jgi:hypothetical protein